MAGGLTPPSRGGFSTFLPPCQAGGVRGMAEVCRQRGGFENSISGLSFLHDVLRVAKGVEIWPCRFEHPRIFA